VKTLFPVLLIGLVISIRADGQTNLPPMAGTSHQTMETLVCIRHGETPPIGGGLGQLGCRGLNRALALPNVLLGKYGKPQFVFAPNPDKKEHGIYNYIRPLITIEPTAVRCSLPVNTDFDKTKDLEQEISKPKYKNATIFIAWEHNALDVFVKNLIKDSGGDPAQVPIWPGNDYDTIFLVKITRSEKEESVAFTIDHEGLNGLSDDCP
jgi:hypothetical protein